MLSDGIAPPQLMMSQFGCHRVAPLLIRAEFPGDLRPGFCLRGAIESVTSTEGLKVTSNLEYAGRSSRRCSYAAVPIFIRGVLCRPSLLCACTVYFLGCTRPAWPRLSGEVR